jgi:hypothetical protein
VTNSINQIYSDTPHALVTQDIDFDGDERDFDLTARIQFVNEGHATGFDFSAYVLVSEDLLDLEEERQKVADEIAAVNNLLEAVEAFHGEFLTQASKALDRLAALQASAQK